MEENEKKNDISKTIVARYGSIKKSDKTNIEINIIRWNNGRNKVDIRPWSSNGVYAQKGLTFSKESFLKLLKILNDVDISLVDSETRVKSSKQEEIPLPEEPKYRQISDDDEFVDEDEEAKIPFIEEEEAEKNSPEEKEEPKTVAS